jgi:hypothetical protein
MPCARKGGDAGEVFIEAIIAAAIVAAALGATCRVISDSAARDRGIEARRAAVMVAQSELADVGAEIPLRPGETAGLTGALAWRVTVSSYADATTAGPLLEVLVTVSPRTGGPALANLRTLRLGAGA